MYDSAKVIFGLLAFLAIVTFPAWYDMSTGAVERPPELERAARGEQCVRDTLYMKGNHMHLLNEWRDAVVRDGNRFETGTEGRTGPNGEATYERSLTKTCLGCHVNKDKFCDRCHAYAGVEPYCWNCHVDPKELQS
jgi:hypothetical protein